MSLRVAWFCSWWSDVETTVLLGFSPLLFYASKGDYDHVEEMYGNWQSCSRVALSVWNSSVYIPHLRYLKWDRHTIPVALNHLSNCWLFSSLFHSVRLWLQNFLFRVWLAYFTTLDTAFLLRFYKTRLFVVRKPFFGQCCGQKYGHSHLCRMIWGF